MKLAHVRRAGLLLLAAGLGLAGARAAPRPPGTTTGEIKDRKGFIPYRKYQALPGKAVGILIGDVRAVMGQEGRSSYPDAMGFSTGGNSYRWVYVPVLDRPNITNFSVPVGEKGERSRTYPKLSMARPETTRDWGINAPYALVEVEVNDGEGSPARETFVATKVKRLDGSRAYPLRLPDVVTDLRKRHARSLQDRQKKIDDALAEVQKNVLKGRKVTGPRQTEELFYITWLPDTQRVRVHVRTKISDGAYQYATLGGRRGPFPLPPPLPPGQGPALAFRPPPPPRPIPVRTGVTFGVELGSAFEVDKTGKVVTVLELPVQSFHQEVPPPRGAMGPGGKPLGAPAAPAPAGR
jgi:hypothetical protein